MFSFPVFLRVLKKGFKFNKTKIKMIVFFQTLTGLQYIDAFYREVQIKRHKMKTKLTYVFIHPTTSVF